MPWASEVEITEAEWGLPRQPQCKAKGLKDPTKINRVRVSEGRGNSKRESVRLRAGLMKEARQDTGLKGWTGLQLS